jgi:hypothetical protein
MAWETYMLRSSFVLVFIRFRVKARMPACRYSWLEERE